MTYNEFVAITDISDLKSIGMKLSDATDLHGLQQKIPKVYFEDTLYMDKFKIRYICITFDDGDVVSYIAKYTQIFNSKSYRLTTFPQSQLKNKEHEKLIMQHLLKICGRSLSIIVYDNELKYKLSEFKIDGYENYYFTYNNLYNKIINNKTMRHYYNKYKNLSVEAYTHIDESLINRILNVYDQWEAVHPNPRKTTKKIILDLLKNPPSDIIIFMTVLNGVDVYFSMCTYDNFSVTGGYSYGLSRYSQYHSIDLIGILMITQYIKDNLNSQPYYYMGYTTENKGLKQFKEKWADDKIINYKITLDNLTREYPEYIEGCD